MAGKSMMVPRWAVALAIALVVGIAAAHLASREAARRHRAAAGDCPRITGEATSSNAARWPELRAARVAEGLQALKERLRQLNPPPLRFRTHPDNTQIQLLIDAAADCVTNERVGAWGDGGKWLCNPYKLPQPCVVYGVGAGWDISFEEEMARRFGCEVHAFDPAPSVVKRFAQYEKPTPLGKGSLVLHPWALGPVSDDPAQAMKLNLEGHDCEVKTLGEIVKLLGHTKVDILKMDIEGGEFAAMRDIRAQSLLKTLKVTQVLTELHAEGETEYAKLVKLVGDLTDDDYLLYRKELNPYGVKCCAEYAFAERSFLVD